METLTRFSEKEQSYHEYQARQNFLREQRTIRWEYEQNLEQERQAKEQERQAKEQAQRQVREAQAEIERLMALLAQREAE